MFTSKELRECALTKCAVNKLIAGLCHFHNLPLCVGFYFCIKMKSFSRINTQKAHILKKPHFQPLGNFVLQFYVQHSCIYVVITNLLTGKSRCRHFPLCWKCRQLNHVPHKKAPEKHMKCYWDSGLRIRFSTWKLPSVLKLKISSMNAVLHRNTRVHSHGDWRNSDVDVQLIYHRFCNT